MRNRILKCMMAVLITVFGILTQGTRISADSESAEVEIKDIKVEGLDCTVALLDEHGTVASQTDIKAGETGSVSVTVSGLGTHTYYLEVLNENTFTNFYDDESYQIEIVLHKKEDGSTGHSYIVKKIDETGAEAAKVHEIVFKNQKQKEMTAKINPFAEKIVYGMPEKASVFEFVLESMNEANPMPEGTVGLKKEASCTGEGKAYFGWLEFHAPGKYNYKIYEKDLGEKYYVYDPEVYDVWFIVEYEHDELKLRWTCEIDGEDSAGLNHATFRNDYIHPTDDPAGDTLKVTKKIEGGDGRKDSFRFELTRDSEAFPMPDDMEQEESGRTVTIQGEGTETFGTITFRQPGTYTYTVRELDDKAEGYTYDKSVYKITYEVVEEGERLLLRRTVVKDGAAYDAANGLVFTNRLVTPTPTPTPTATPEPTTPPSGSNPPYIPPYRWPVPFTGDEFNPVLWAGGIVLAAAAAFIVIRILQKDKQK